MKCSPDFQKNRTNEAYLDFISLCMRRRKRCRKRNGNANRRFDTLQPAFMALRECEKLCLLLYQSVTCEYYLVAVKAPLWFLPINSINPAGKLNASVICRRVTCRSRCRCGSLPHNSLPLHLCRCTCILCRYGPVISNSPQHGN